MIVESSLYGRREDFTSASVSRRRDQVSLSIVNTLVLK